MVAIEDAVNKVRAEEHRCDALVFWIGIHMVFHVVKHESQIAVTCFESLLWHLVAIPEFEIGWELSASEVWCGVALAFVCAAFDHTIEFGEIVGWIGFVRHADGGLDNVMHVAQIHH